MIRYEMDKTKTDGRETQGVPWDNHRWHRFLLRAGGQDGDGHLTDGIFRLTFTTLRDMGRESRAAILRLRCLILQVTVYLAKKR